VPVSFTTCGLVLAPSVIVAAPGMLPVLPGVNITLNVHLAPAARLVLQGIVPPEVTEKSALPAKLDKPKAEVELFVKVSVCGLLVEFTACDAKVRLAGAMVTGRPAVPVRLTTCWLIAALSEITSAPWMAPAIDGEKVTLSVQLAPAISVEVLVHGVAPLPTSLKFPLVAIEEKVTLLPLMFCTVSVFPALVVPVAWLVNAKVAGVNFSGEVPPPVPVPVSLISCGLYVAPYVTVTAPSILPSAVGVKTTEITHVAPGPRVGVVQVVPLLFVE
jgi:hypothetical protein